MMTELQDPNTQKQSRLVKSAIRGTFWVYAANYSGKALIFLSTIILARLLTKADYGLAGYALVVIGFLDVFIDLGVSAAIIFYPEDERTTNSAFWINLATGFLLYGATWLLAPMLGAFFNEPRAVDLTRVLALTFPLSSLSNIHAALLTKNLTFKRKFIPDFVKALGKGLISITLAWLDFGAWSLVLGQVGGTAIAVIAYWIVMPWKPSLSIRFDRGINRSLLSFGVNIVAVDSLGVTLNNTDYLIVGRILGAEALGVYTLAFRIPELLVKSFCNLVGNVLFPAYSKLRDDEQALRNGFLISMRSITLVTVPIGLGIATVSRPMILTLFTEKWVDAIPVMSAIALYTLIRSLTFNIGNIYKAQGRPDILTKLSLLKVPILLPALYWAATGPGTIDAIAWVQVGVALIAGAMNLVVAARVLKMPLKEMWIAFQPALIAGSVMAAAVLAALALVNGASPIIQLTLGVLTGGLVYTGMIWWLQRDFVIKASSSLRAAFSRS
jgi:O-antigen/teichoic acid export membrane protein